jgi:hypothetical protein
MVIAELCRDLRSHWLALSHYLWPETPREQAQADQARLTEELRRRRHGLVRRRRQIEQLQADLARLEREAARLTAQVRHPPGRADEAAWQAALSLDRLRRACTLTRARLEHHEAAYERQRLRFQVRKQRWAEQPSLFRC